MPRPCSDNRRKQSRAGRQPQPSGSSADLLRALVQRIERAIDAAPPEKSAALIPKLAPLMQQLVDATAAEEARRDREQAFRLQDLFDEEAKRLIAERAEERALFMLNPPDWEMDNRAKILARKEGGDWLTLLDRVYADHAAWLQTLIERKPEETDIRTWLREG